MVAEQPFDITNLPDLARLADEVRRTRRPRVLRRAGEDLAILLPLPVANAQAAPRRPRNLGKEIVVARTAGALRSDIAFPGIAEEKLAAEQAIADDVVARMNG